MAAIFEKGSPGLVFIGAVVIDETGCKPRLEIVSLVFFESSEAACRLEIVDGGPLLTIPPDPSFLS